MIHLYPLNTLQEEILKRLEKGEHIQFIADDLNMPLADVMTEECIARHELAKSRGVKESELSEFIRMALILIITLLPSLDNMEEARVFRTTTRIARTVRNTRTRREELI